MIFALGTERYVFLAKKIQDALNSGDKEVIGRILGSLTRAQCVELNKTYNTRIGASKTLEEHMKAKLSGVYLENALNLVLASDDSEIGCLQQYLTPTGNNYEAGVEDGMVMAVGSKAMEAAIAGFQEIMFITRAEAHCDKNGIARPDVSMPSWDGVGMGKDEAALIGMLKEYQDTYGKLVVENANIHQAIEFQDKKRYFDSTAAAAELAEWDRILSKCCAALETHISLRDAIGVHKYADTATDILSSDSVADLLIQIVCCRSRKQISDANAQFFLKFQTDMASYVERQMNKSDFTKFIYYVIASSMHVGPNATFSVTYPGNMIINVELIHEAISVSEVRSV